MTTPRRDAHGRFLPKRRRNPGLRGSVYGKPPEFHPYRNSPGYEPARAEEKKGERRRPRQRALTGLPRMTTAEARRVQARERHARLVEQKRAKADERDQRASELRGKRAVLTADRTRRRAAEQQLADVQQRRDAARERRNELAEQMRTSKNRSLRGRFAAANHEYQTLASQAAFLKERLP